ncbi:class I SAM-dependent methyltransferase [Acidovorax sp. sif1233]|uniref:class I SAM-dependent methyltransferase n=1 Tax=unclassified Acidovorax TaxID=2684926 RepID=UPI001C455790|nr:MULTISPECIES: methyltransferase domain-containing protein [unclassified Acidovorax]MBV7427993.1 class I SAM-dependent methyltransferase [Acidovorax sp. sif0732]MBV7449250.1 class I SAM-dependent methyltransferase [Acidovorax sp. sif0715]MBV7455766.1 class I SAM-dependent methyltransferase [Acidovorax sp. sif1233]
MNIEKAKQLVASVKHWHHAFEIYPGLFTPGTYDPRFLLNDISFPPDLRGQRVLDIGPSDGFFSLAAHRLGAEVVAIDYRSKDAHGFGVMEEISGRDFQYHRANVYDLNVKELGTFDHVLFLGVLYHLPDMVKALGIVRSLCHGVMYLESHAANDLPTNEAQARYYRSNTLAADITNFWSPNPACIHDMAFDSAFDLVSHRTWSDRYFGRFTINEEPVRKRKLQLGYGLLQ